MPGRGGSGHARSHSSVDHGLRISHSGMWVGRDAGPDDSTQMHLIDFPYEQVPRIRTTEVREHGQFVTVVEVEKDDADKSGSTRHASRAATQPVPRPRGFVTVVAVGNNADTSLHLNTGNVAVDANLKHRTEHRADVEADYVNQEMIDRERKTAEEWQTETVPDQVVVYRLPGERLGLGLKFDGGMGARERVRRLFIQSVAPDSPAARAAVPWGELQPGDQILNIEGWAVSSMTRVQCVSFLKDAAMKITIGVHKGNGQLPDFDMCTSEAPEYVKEEGQEEAEAEDDNEDSSRPPPLIVGEMRKRLPPPPLPPRARPRKSPARPPKDPTPVPPPPSAFQDLYDESGEKMARGMYPTSGNSEDVEHSMHGWREYVLSRRTRPSDLEELLEDLEFHLPRTWTTRRVDESMDGGLPPRPTFYVDLVGEEDAMGPCGSESDETSSSVSTVIDRLSLCSSTNVSRNSSFNASADASRFDLARALSPFEQLEKELETDTQQQQQTPATAPRDEVMPAPPIDRSTKPTTAESSIPEVEQHAAVSRKTSSSKIKMRPSIKSFSFSLKGRPFSWQQGKSASDRGVSRSDTFLSIKKPGKRPAPPPPPRSIDSGTRQSESPPTVTSSMGVETGMGIRERISHPDNDTIHDDSDNYIDLIAEAANQNLHNETTAVTSNVSEREVTTKVAKEELTLPFLAQVKQPKHSPEYLLILDSPPGPDVLDKFPDKSFYTGVAGDVNSELPDTVQEEYKSLGAGERVVIQAETSPRSVTTPPEVIELCTSDHNSESLQQESSLSEATASSAGGGSPCLSDDYIFSTSQNCIETRAQVHHALDDTVDTETIAICQSLENEDLETGSVRELSNKGEMDNGIDVEVSELDGSKSPDDSGEVDVSTDIDASVDDEFDERTVESTKLTYNSGLISVTGRDNGTNINGTPLVDNIMEADSSERTDGYSETVGDVSEKVDDDVSEKVDDDVSDKADDVNEKVDDIAEKVDDVSEMVDDVSEKVDISEKVDDVSEMVDDVSEKVDDVSEMVDDVSEKVDDVSEMVDDVSEKVDDVSEMVDISEKADDVSEKVDISEKVDDVSEKVDISEKADDVSEKVDDISEKVDVSEKVDDDVSEKVDDDVSEKVDISEKADVSEKVDISEKADVSEKVDISEKSDDISEKSDDISEKADDASEMVDDISEKTDDSMKGDYSTEGEVSTDYDDSEMLISESLDDSCERNDNQQTAVSNAKAEETYVQDNIAGIPEEEEEEGFLSCSSPKTSPTEPLLPGRAPKLPGVAEEEGLYEDLYDECYPLDTPADPRSRGPRDFNVARSLRREVSRALPIVPEEDSGDLDTTEGDLTALYDDIADESGEGTSAEAMSLDVSDEVDMEGLAVPSVQLETGGSKASLTIGQCSRQRRLRPDLGDLIRREMNLSDDVTVEVEEEEEVENLVECENEKELLLVMRALRQEHSSDHLRWLQDDSEGDDDDAGGGGGGGGAGGGTSEGSDGATEGDDHHRESDEGEDEHEDEPAAEDVCKDDPAGGGQGAAARALSDPQVGGGEGGKKEEEVVGGEKQLPPSFSPPQVAAAHSPATSLHHHSLAQGTTRHPRHATLPLTRALPSHAGGRPHAHATHHAQDTASEIGLASGGEPRVTQTVRQADHSPNWSLVSSEGAFECAAREESSQSATCGVRSVVARTLESATSSGTAMVARTDTNQAGKVTNCLDNVESLALLARGGEQDKGEAGDGAAPVAPDAEGAISLGGTSDASSSDGEEPQVAETSRSSEDTPEPPDFSTHPMCTGKAAVARSTTAATKNLRLQRLQKQQQVQRQQEEQEQQHRMQQQ
nr:uncharacterized protein LOC123763891 [Procambarus clarkii]